MNPRVLIAVLTAIQFIHFVDFVLMMPLGPQLQRELGCSPASFSGLVAAYVLSGGVAAAASILVIDRFDRRRVLLALLFGLVVTTLACGLAHGYAQLLAARIAAGACGGVLGGLIFTIIGEQVPPERRGAATGAVMRAFSLASVLGVPFGTLLAQRYAWEAPFLVLAGMAALVLAAATLALRPMRGHLDAPRRPPLEVVRTVLAEPSHRRAFAFTAVLTLAGFTVIPLLATYLVRNARIGEEHVAWFYGLGGAATAVTGPLIGRLADRLGAVRVFTWVAALSIPAILVATSLPPVPLAAALASGVAFMVLVSGRFVPAMALVTRSARPDVRGAFQASNTVVQSLASGVAAVVAGLVVSAGPDGVLRGYAAAGAVAVVATAGAMMLVRRLQPA